MKTVDMIETINELDKALNAPGKIRLIIIKWIFPEMITVANKLRETYWR